MRTGASSQIRGQQVARALRCEFGTKSDPDAEAVVFVKEPPSRPVLDYVRQRHQLVFYDPVDNYDFRTMAGLDVDAVMACNRSHCRKLKTIFPNAVVKIVPHHHCRLDGDPLTTGSDLIGYVGDPKNLGIDVDRLGREFPGIIITRDLKALRQIGIGLAYRPPGIERSYKSNVKLANYWAHGAVAVCSPDTSYIEMGGGDGAWFAHTEEEAIAHIHYLRDNEDVRRRFSQLNSKRSRMYNVSSIAKYYLSFLDLVRRQ